MDIEEYNNAISEIQRQLQDIADRTANQAIIGIADSSNPDFIALMKRHTQLTKLSTELTERMLQNMQGS